jgi:hypothetical protein
VQVLKGLSFLRQPLLLFICNAFSGAQILATQVPVHIPGHGAHGGAAPDAFKCQKQRLTSVLLRIGHQRYRCPQEKQAGSRNPMVQNIYPLRGTAMFTAANHYIKTLVHRDTGISFKITFAHKGGGTSLFFLYLRKSQVFMQPGLIPADPAQTWPPGPNQKKHSGPAGSTMLLT